MSVNEKVSSVFKESLDKLNSMLMFLDTQLGTVSLSKEEIDYIVEVIILWIERELEKNKLKYFLINQTNSMCK